MNARQEWLLSRWEAACQDPELAKLPHKIELNEWGKIELTPPAPPIHGSFAFRVARLLDASLGGEASVECPVLTDIGVRVPDAVWVPEQRRQELRGRQPLQAAPEICVEVLSSSNTLEELTEKTKAYLVAGAREVTWVDPRGHLLHKSGGACTSSTMQAAARLWICTRSERRPPSGRRRARLRTTALVPQLDRRAQDALRHEDDEQHQQQAVDASCRGRGCRGRARAAGPRRAAA